MYRIHPPHCRQIPFLIIPNIRINIEADLGSDGKHLKFKIHRFDRLNENKLDKFHGFTPFSSEFERLHKPKALGIRKGKV